MQKVAYIAIKKQISERKHKPIGSYTLPCLYNINWALFVKTFGINSNNYVVRSWRLKHT